MLRAWASDGVQARRVCRSKMGIDKCRMFDSAKRIGLARNRPTNGEKVGCIGRE